MKLLIIAGPYEADRIRRAAVAAHFETVAVEPGESLSGWISASRPDAIIMAPRMVNADPVVALAKIRSVPRGRVPIFLVGDADDADRLRGLADGFFVRPISPEDLIAEARARLVRDAGAVTAPGDGKGSGPQGAPGEAPITAVGHDASDNPDFVRPTLTPKGGSHAAKVQGFLRPLVATGGRPSPPVTAASGEGAAELWSQLSRSIDETLDAEIQDAIRGLADEASLSSARTAEDEALAELRDESSQKTREVPTAVVAKMSAAAASDEELPPLEPQRGDGDGDGAQARRRGQRRPPPSATARVEIAHAPLERGPIGSPDIAVLLGRVFSEGLTGLLTFRRGAAEKSIAFLHGAPLTARSNLSEDRMGEMLVRQGRVSPHQREEGGAAAAASGRRLGAVLVEMGVLKAGELAPLVRRHFEEIVCSLFAWRKEDRQRERDDAAGDAAEEAGRQAHDGEWTLGPDEPDPGEDIGMIEPPPALIMEGIRRKNTAARSLECLGGEAQIFRLREEGGTSRILDKMGLGEPERAIAALFDGARSLAEVRALSDLPEGVVLGVAWALVTLARLERVPVAGAAGEDTVSSAAAAAVASVRPDDAADDGETVRNRAIDRARVLARYELVREGDYFQLLGLSRDASSHEVLRASQALARELSAQVLDPALVAELGAELGAIRAVVDEGARVLADPRMRQRYLSHLPPSPAEPRADAPPPAGSPQP